MEDGWHPYLKVLFKVANLTYGEKKSVAENSASVHLYQLSLRDRFFCFLGGFFWSFLELNLQQYGGTQARSLIRA